MADDEWGPADVDMTILRFVEELSEVFVGD